MHCVAVLTLYATLRVSRFLLLQARFFVEQRMAQPSNVKWQVQVPRLCNVFMGKKYVRVCLCSPFRAIVVYIAGNLTSPPPLCLVDTAALVSC